MGQGAFIFGCAGLTLTDAERAFFQDTDPWGFILFARNVETPDQVRRLTSELRDAVGRDAPVLIDQEGGRVQRLRAPEWREWLPPLDQIVRAGPKAMELRYRLIAHELRDIGIDTNCAPMADIAFPQTHEFLKNRCYGGEVKTVVSAARAVADGLLAGGVLPVLKHIPGHGRATLDSHLELPRVETDAETLHQTDFAAFKVLSDLPIAMTAHIVYSAFDPDLPATTSSIMMSLIRDQIGFDGLIMSDDISMQALSGSIADRSAASIAAGCDIILHCNGDMTEMEQVAQAAGEMDDLASDRANRALSHRKTPEKIDIAALEAEFETLLNGRADG